jgi:hypothetical protein
MVAKATVHKQGSVQRFKFVGRFEFGAATFLGQVVIRTQYRFRISRQAIICSGHI